jgi:hypothetical protein
MRSRVGAIPPSQPEHYISGATAVTLWLFGAGSWHWGSGCGSEETTPPWSASKTSPHPAKKSQVKILKLVTRQRFLRFSILKETPTPLPTGGGNRFWTQWSGLAQRRPRRSSGLLILKKDLSRGSMLLSSSSSTYLTLIF